MSALLREYGVATINSIPANQGVETSDFCYWFGLHTSIW